MIYRLEISPRPGQDDPAGHSIKGTVKSILDYCRQCSSATI